MTSKADSSEWTTVTNKKQKNIKNKKNKQNHKNNTFNLEKFKDSLISTTIEQKVDLNLGFLSKSDKFQVKFESLAERIVAEIEKQRNDNRESKFRQGHVAANFKGERDAIEAGVQRHESFESLRPDSKKEKASENSEIAIGPRHNDADRRTKQGEGLPIRSNDKSTLLSSNSSYSDTSDLADRKNDLVFCLGSGSLENSAGSRNQVRLAIEVAKKSNCLPIKIYDPCYSESEIKFFEKHKDIFDLTSDNDECRNLGTSIVNESSNFNIVIAIHMYSKHYVNILNSFSDENLALIGNSLPNILKSAEFYGEEAKEIQTIIKTNSYKTCLNLDEAWASENKYDNSFSDSYLTFIL